MLKWTLRLALGLLVLALLLGQRETLLALLQTLRAVPFWAILASVIFYGAGQLLCAYKWQILLRKRGANVGLGACARAYFAGMFGNLWLPTNIGGDALKTAILHREIAPKNPQIGLSDVAASVVVERLTGFLALLFLGALGALWSGARNAQTLQILGGALGVLAVFAGVIWVSKHVKHRKIQLLRAALNLYAQPQNRATLGVALALSLAFQVSQIVLNIGLARAANLGVSDAIFWWLGPLLSLSGLVPIGIGGLGVREAAAVAFLGGTVPYGAIVGWSLLWQATVWLCSLPGVLFVRRLPREVKNQAPEN